MTRAVILSVAALLVLSAGLSPAQQSDFELKRAFEERSQSIKRGIDDAKALVVLDSLKSEIDALEQKYSGRAGFLDKALYPQTFGSTIDGLRTLHSLTYDRVYLIQTQGIRVAELEAQIASLSRRLDSLTVERDKLFQELADAKKNTAALREVVKRLTSNLQAKDKLLFAMTDTIFLPYGKDMSQAGTMQKEAVSRKLEQANVLGRVQEIASDNVRFLEMTQLQGKDYAALIDQYDRFSGRWAGLREKIVAVAAAPEPQAPAAKPTAKPKAGAKGAEPQVTPRPAPGAEVDSLTILWYQKLQSSFWAALQKEFTDRALPVKPFNDAHGFSESIRSYVDMVKVSGEDPSVFVNDVWKLRVDRDWREALSKDSMLGSVEYASLDRVVSELGAEKFDIQFLIYAIVLILLAGAIWWFFGRKQKAKPQAPPAAKASP